MRSMRTVLGLLLLLCGVIAHAHDLSLSTIRIEYLRSEVRVTVTTPISRLFLAEGKPTAAFSPVATDIALRRHLQLRLGDEEFVPANADVTGDDVTDMLTWQASVPRKEGGIEVVRLYPEDPNSRSEVIWIVDGKELNRTLLTSQDPSMAGDITVRTNPPFEAVTECIRSLPFLLLVAGLFLGKGDRKSAAYRFAGFTVGMLLGGFIFASWNERGVTLAFYLCLVGAGVLNLRTDSEPDVRALWATLFALPCGSNLIQRLPTPKNWISCLEGLIAAVVIASVVAAAVYFAADSLRGRFPKLVSYATTTFAITAGVFGAYQFFSLI